MITMDLHSKEIQGFFNCPVDNLRASPFLIQYIQDKVSATEVVHLLLFYLIRGLQSSLFHCHAVVF